MITTERLLNRKEVELATGFSCTSIYRLMRAGKFPEPLKVGERAVRWPESEIVQWLAERPRATGENKPDAATSGGREYQHG